MKPRRRTSAVCFGLGISCFIGAASIAINAEELDPYSKAFFTNLAELGTSTGLAFFGACLMLVGAILHFRNLLDDDES